MEDKRLRQRPEAEARNIEKLLDRVSAGVHRIPPFQRPLRWRSQHIIQLFDSIWRGFPIGELLLSRQPAPAEQLNFGPVVIHADARSDALMVVDGQQRVVSLAGVLLHPDPKPRGGVHAIWFDLEQQGFVRLTKANPPVHWIPLREVVDSARLLRWLHEWPLRSERPDLVDRAILLGKAIREYEVPAYIVHDAEDQVLRLIFNRINNSGERMREEEVFDALHGAEGRKPLAESCARIAEEGFGEIEGKWFLRALKAVGEIDPKRRASEIDLEQNPTVMAATEAAVRRALTFLVTDAEIPHRDLLPYNLPLVILARFFNLHSEPSVRNRGLLVRWVWRGALSGVHAASSDAEVRRLSALIDGDETASVQRLLGTVPRDSTPPDPRDPWQTGGAKTRLLALAMLAVGPLDPHTESGVSVAELQELEEPSHLFIDMHEPRRRSGPVARFVVLAGDPQQKLEQLKTASESVLNSHVLSRPMLDALAAGDEAQFVALRADALDRITARYFAVQAGSEDSDRPAIRDIVRHVEVA
jgi:hypothetical protein